MTKAKDSPKNGALFQHPFHPVRQYHSTRVSDELLIRCNHDITPYWRWEITLTYSPDNEAKTSRWVDNRKSIVSNSTVFGQNDPHSRCRNKHTRSRYITCHAPAKLLSGGHIMFWKSSRTACSSDERPTSWSGNNVGRGFPSFAFDAVLSPVYFSAGFGFPTTFRLGPCDRMYVEIKRAKLYPRKPWQFLYKVCRAKGNTGMKYTHVCDSKLVCCYSLNTR